MDEYMNNEEETFEQADRSMSDLVLDALVSCENPALLSFLAAMTGRFLRAMLGSYPLVLPDGTACIPFAYPFNYIYFGLFFLTWVSTYFMCKHINKLVALALGTAIQPFLRVLPLAIGCEEFYPVLVAPFLAAIVLLAFFGGKDAYPKVTPRNVIPLSLCATMALTIAMPVVGEAAGTYMPEAFAVGYCTVAENDSYGVGLASDVAKSIHEQVGDDLCGSVRVTPFFSSADGAFMRIRRLKDGSRMLEISSPHANGYEKGRLIKSAIKMTSQDDNSELLCTEWSIPG